MPREIIHNGRTYVYVGNFLTTPLDDPTPARLVVNNVFPKKRAKILRMGIFFDGTGQNRYNDERLPDRDISNIAKLRDLYFETETDDIIYRREYFAGVGTVADEEKKDGFAPGQYLAGLVGLGAGIGPVGGHVRIREALTAIQEAINKSQCTEVILDVFGFSRGASLARHFTNLVNAWPATVNIPRLVADRLSSELVQAFPQHVQGRVGFLGLFDTVGSFYIPGNNQEFDFNLNLASHSADHVVQLTAYHEIRENFPLTRIGEAAPPLPANFIELTLPGVHADVGGGYENPTHNGFENWEVIRVGTRSGHGLNHRTTQIAQRDAERNGLYIRINGPDIILERRLPTRKELSIYALHKMHELAQDNGVPISDLDHTDPGHIIPAELLEKLTAWEAAGSRLEDAKRYLDGYIHTSHREGTLVDAPAPNNIRREFYSVAERATTREDQYAAVSS